jgi:hypothetical protein
MLARFAPCHRMGGLSHGLSNSQVPPSRFGSTPGALRQKARVLGIPLGHRRTKTKRAWAGAEAELDRRQGTTGKHLQGGQPLSALAARGRGLISDPASQADGLYAPGLARRADGPPAGKGCRHRVGQQDRPHRLGADGARYALQRACSASDLRYTRPTRAHEVGKGNERIMHPAGRSGDRDTPLVPRQLLTACF